MTSRYRFPYWKYRSSGLTSNLPNQRLHSENIRRWSMWTLKFEKNSSDSIPPNKLLCSPFQLVNKMFKIQISSEKTGLILLFSPILNILIKNMKNFNASIYTVSHFLFFLICSEDQLIPTFNVVQIYLALRCFCPQMKGLHVIFILIFL